MREPEGGQARSCQPARQHLADLQFSPNPRRVSQLTTALHARVPSTPVGAEVVARVIVIRIRDRPWLLAWLPMVAGGGSRHWEVVRRLTP